MNEVMARRPQYVTRALTRPKHLVRLVMLCVLAVTITKPVTEMCRLERYRSTGLHGVKNMQATQLKIPSRPESLKSAGIARRLVAVAALSKAEMNGNLHCLISG